MCMGKTDCKGFEFGVWGGKCKLLEDTPLTIDDPDDNVFCFGRVLGVPKPLSLPSPGTVRGNLISFPL